jgi:hypothetical protein
VAFLNNCPKAMIVTSLPMVLVEAYAESSIQRKAIAIREALEVLTVQGRVSMENLLDALETPVVPSASDGRPVVLPSGGIVIVDVTQFVFATIASGSTYSRQKRFLAMLGIIAPPQSTFYKVQPDVLLLFVEMAHRSCGEIRDAIPPLELVDGKWIGTVTGYDMC